MTDSVIAYPNLHHVAVLCDSEGLPAYEIATGAVSTMHAVSGLPSPRRRRTRHRRAPHLHQTSPGIRHDLRLRRCTSPGPAHISMAMTNSIAFLTCAFEATPRNRTSRNPRFVDSLQLEHAPLRARTTRSRAGHLTSPGRRIPPSTGCFALLVKAFIIS